MRLAAAGLLALVVTLAGGGSAEASVVDLTADASTIVPAAVNAGAVDAFGQPYEVRSRVTAVRFHNGALASTAAGGLDTAPHPALKSQNGVSYYQVTGELSGVGHSPIGFEYVYGPIGADGVDRSADPASPRFGLRGVPFRLIYPAKGWNGHLIAYRNGGDGGTGSGHYLYQSLTDELALVQRGYAYFVTLGGGTTPPDSNPDSPSGLFWKLAPPLWAPPSEAAHPASFRPAGIGSDWSESLIPDSSPGRIWFVGDPAPVPLSSATPLQDLQIGMQDDVPTFRDHIAVAKNLAQLLLGSRPSQTGVLAWSRSGDLAVGMDLGRTTQPSGSLVPSLGGNPDLYRSLSPRTGGDFNTPYVPGSGRVADWFVVRSGLEGTTVHVPPDGQPDFADMLPDPDYPIAAPMIYINGETDLNYVAPNGYLIANLLADALPGSRLGDKDINSWYRLYVLRGATHQPREAWYAGPYDGGTTWYEDGGAGFNHDGHGLEMPAWMDSLRANNADKLGDVPFSLDGLNVFSAGSLSEEGFSLKAILNADRWARSGKAPPVSSVDRNLVRNVTADTVQVTYPVATACTPDVLAAGDRSCLQTLTGDSVVNDPNEAFGVLDPFIAGIYRAFATGPLRYTTDPINLPGQAVPLGYRLYTSTAVFVRPFTRAELKARYRTHAGYVARVGQAAAKLVRRGLYDSRIRAWDIATAARSPILR